MYFIKFCQPILEKILFHGFSHLEFRICIFSESETNKADFDVLHVKSQTDKENPFENDVKTILVQKVQIREILE